MTMSTGAIIAIVVGAVIVLAILAFLLMRMLPRMRARREERRLNERREAVAGAHRDVAEQQTAQAQLAEREAQRARAEAQLHETRADLHERGLADDELDRDPVADDGDAGTATRDGDGAVRDDVAHEAR
jgi:uncharacterized membrane protein YcjF (UPF0283 family)